MSDTAFRNPLSRKLPRLGLIAGLACAVMLLLTADGTHVTSASGAEVTVSALPIGSHTQSSARRCVPPPCPVRPNAALPRKRGKP